MKALLLAALLFAAPAHAEDHPLRLPATVFLIAAEADAITTFYGQQRYGSDGFREVTPGYASMSPEAAFAVGHAVDLGTVWIATTIGKRHPTIAALGLYALAALRFEMVRETLNHLDTMRGREDRRVTVPIVVINLGSGEGH